VRDAALTGVELGCFAVAADAAARRVLRTSAWHRRLATTGAAGTTAFAAVALAVVARHRIFDAHEGAA